jgi:predicted ATPase
MGEPSTSHLIRTPDQRLRVFVSSTLGELADERAAVRRAIEQLRLTPVMFELGARPHPARSLYRAYLEQSDVFVGIYWERYGWVAPDETISGLEDEYRLSGDLPRLMYLKGPAPGRDERLAELIGRIQADDTTAYKHFSTPDELERLVTEDLAILLSERFMDRSTSVDGPTLEIRSFGVHLPEPATALIGRDEELWELETLLEAPENRLVTLVGPGGIGKTRLAIDLARLSIPLFADGVVMVGLETATDPSEVLPAVARALGASADRATDLSNLIATAIGHRRVLLLLDNCEHVVDVAPELAGLLERCPGLKLLATSRTPLNVRAERDFLVPPLEVPGRSIPDAEETAAVRLFVDRAERTRADFAITDDNRDAVREIARRLEGIPLALELAATRVRLLTPQGLLERLDASLDLLASQAPDMPDRQRTLRATIEWSTSMLRDHERELFERLAVFEGGWTLDAVEAVCGDEIDVLDALSGLVEQSLVSPWSVADAEPRFRMYEVIRTFAREVFETRPDGAQIEARHRNHFAELARGAEPLLRSVDHAIWMNRLEPEWGNIEVAWQRALRDDEVNDAVDLAAGIWIVLWLRGRLGEVLPLLAATEEHRDALERDRRARLDFVAGAASYTTGDYERAATYFDQFDDLDDLDDPGLQGAVWLYRGFLAADRWDARAVRRYLDRCEAVLRDSDEMWVRGYCMSVRGSLAHWEGNCELACRYHGEALEIARSSGNDALAMQSLIFQALACVANNHLDDASAYLRESAELIELYPFYEATAYAFDAAAGIAVRFGDPSRAACALGAAELVREVGMAAVWPLLRGLLEETVARVDEALDEAEVTRLREVGRRMAPHEAARLVVEITSRSPEGLPQR